MKLKSIFGFMAVFLLMFFASFSNAEIYQTDEPETEQVQKQTAESVTFIFTADTANAPEQIADFEHRQRYSKLEKGFITDYKSPTQIATCNIPEQSRYIQLKGFIYTDFAIYTKATLYSNYFSTYGLANTCS